MSPYSPVRDPVDEIPLFVEDALTVPIPIQQPSPFLEQALQLGYQKGREEKKRNPVVSFVVIIAVFIIAIALLSHGRYPAAWFGMNQQPAQPVSLTPPTPQQATTAGPQDNVELGVPKSLTIWHGQPAILYAQIDGTYKPSGQTIDPPGDNPVLIDDGTYSQVGTGMKTAFLAGHSIEGDPDPPFNLLSQVQPGDVVEVTVPKGVVYFAVDPPGVVPHPKGTWVPPTGTPDMLYGVSCSLSEGDTNVAFAAHRISSKSTV